MVVSFNKKYKIGMARQMSPMLLGKSIEGIYHTGLVIYGIEYYYGGGICEGQPKVYSINNNFKENAIWLSNQRN